MSKIFLIAFAVGLGCVGLVVVGVLYMQRGAHIDLPGQILKTRTAALDENSSIAVFDFRVTNPADYTFVVRTVGVAMEDQDGKRIEGTPVAEADTQRLFEGLPVLGQKYNASLIAGSNVLPHASQDWMLAVRFDVPEARLESRKRFTFRVEEVDGAVAQFSDK